MQSIPETNGKAQKTSMKEVRRDEKGIKAEKKVMQGELTDQTKGDLIKEVIRYEGRR